jgi:ankyrin repeat protein
MPGLRDFLLFSLSLKNALHFVTAQNEPIQSLHTFGGVEWKSTTVKNIDDLHETNPALVKTKVGWAWPMHYAVLYDAPLETVKRLYQLFPNSLKMKADGGYTPLHFAAQSARVNIIPFLLSAYLPAAEILSANRRTPFQDGMHNADVAALLENPEKTGARYAAGFYNNYSGVHSLYSSSASLWSQTSPETLRKLYNEDIQILTKRHPQTNKRPQDYAFEHGAPVAIVDKMVELSGIPLYRGVFSLFSKSRQKWQSTTATMIDDLHYTNTRNLKNKVLVKTLVEGMLPIHLAALHGAPEKTLERLRQLNPESLKTKNKDGRLPIHCAVIGNATLNIIKLFYHRYPDSLGITDHEGFTPLHFAAQNDREHLITFLVEMYPGAKNMQTVDGNLYTPLTLAQQRQNERAVRLLHPGVSNLRDESLL